MRPLKRKGVRKGKSSKKFNSKARKTKYANVHPGPMRGGIRA